MLAAAIIDTDAFWHVALYGVLGAVGLVLAFSVALLGFDRAEGPDAGADGSVSGAARAGWLLLTALGGAACLALLGVGIWAMTQK